MFGCSRSEPDWTLQGYTHVCLDVADESAVSAFCGQIRKHTGRMDNLINNAGVASMNHSLLTPGESVEKLLRTNVLGSFLFCREAAKIMKKRKYGRIVNFSTVAVPLKLEGEAAYVASKAAVESMTQVLAREFGSFGVTVNALGPTPVDTDLIRAIPQQKIDSLVKRQAVQRKGRYEDVLNVVDFFLRPESEFITGQILYLGGV